MVAWSAGSECRNGKQIGMHEIRIGLRLTFTAAAIAVVVLSLLPRDSLPSVGMSDKYEHLVAYALLAANGWLAFPTRRAALWLMLLLPLMGITLELAQTFVPGRSGEVADALVGALGAYLLLVPMLLCQGGAPFGKRREPRQEGSST
jgi:VanZ family protein